MTYHNLPNCNVHVPLIQMPLSSQTSDNIVGIYVIVGVYNEK